MAVIELRGRPGAYGNVREDLQGRLAQRLSLAHTVSAGGHAHPDMVLALEQSPFVGAGVYVQPAAGDEARRLQHLLQQELSRFGPVRIGEGPLEDLAGACAPAVAVEVSAGMDADAVTLRLQQGVDAYLAYGNADEVPVTVMGSDIPLDPKTGGRSIDASALEPGDIIVTTGTGYISQAIRMVTGPVSHAMLYIGTDVGGNHWVAEAVGGGVAKHRLDGAIGSDETTVAVAFRHPTLDDGEPYDGRSSHPYLTPMLAFVEEHAKLKTPFNDDMLLEAGKFQIAKSGCRLARDPKACVKQLAEVSLGRSDNKSFICSEFVLQAFKKAGLPLTSGSSRSATPSDLGRAGIKDADISLSPISVKLRYVGHLKA